MSAAFCHSCTHCGAEPIDGHPSRRACAAAPEKLAAHMQKSESALIGFWTSPRDYTYTNSQAAESCAWFEVRL